MTITTMNGLVSALGSGETFELLYPSGTTVAGGLTLLNKLVVGAQGQLATPTAKGSSGAIQNNTAAAGVIPYTDPSAQKYIAMLNLTMATAGIVYVYDRVYAASGFSGTVSPSAQTITTPPNVSRPDSVGTGNQIFLESNSPVGSTASNVTVSYVGTDGNTYTTVSEAIIASFPAGRVQHLRLQAGAGNIGVKSITSVTLSASTLTAGDFSVAIYRPLGIISTVMLANGASIQNFAALGLPIVGTDAQVVFVHQGTTTSTGSIQGSIKFIEG